MDVCYYVSEYLLALGEIQLTSRIDTRSFLIEKATEIFADKGYRGTTIGQIAKETGLSEGALYRHFSGKEELFNECIRPALEQALILFKSESLDTRDLRSFVRLRTKIRLQFFKENYALYKILFNEITYRPDLLESILDYYFANQKNVQEVTDTLASFEEIKRKRNYFIIALGQIMTLWNVFHLSQIIHSLGDKLPLDFSLMSEEHLLDDFTDFVVYGIAGRPDE